MQKDAKHRKTNLKKSQGWENRKMGNDDKNIVEYRQYCANVERSVLNKFNAQKPLTDIELLILWHANHNYVNNNGRYYAQLNQIFMRNKILYTSLYRGMWWDFEDGTKTNHSKYHSSEELPLINLEAGEKITFKKFTSFTQFYNTAYCRTLPVGYDTKENIRCIVEINMLEALPLGFIENECISKPDFSARIVSKRWEEENLCLIKALCENYNAQLIGGRIDYLCQKDPFLMYRHGRKTYII